MNAHDAVLELTDEQVLRNLIEQSHNDSSFLKGTDDEIFVSGAYARPMVGKEAFKTTQPIPEVIAEERRNQTIESALERLVVAESGDLAYDYSHFTIEFDKPDDQHVRFGGSSLRVWRKVEGEWLVEATFMRPNRAE